MMINSDVTLAKSLSSFYSFIIFLIRLDVIFIHLLYRILKININSLSVLHNMCYLNRIKEIEFTMNIVDGDTNRLQTFFRYENEYILQRT